MTLYNSIGNGYNSTRRADPFIAEHLYHLLAPVHNQPYLDIGCGTGNYLEALTQRGLGFYGIDPSETMLEVARQKNTGATLLNGVAENIPIPDNFFHGAMAVLTLHHWQSLPKGLSEVFRVLKPGAKLAAFSFSPRQMSGYWLNAYFPEMMEKSSRIIPEQEDMEQLLVQSGFSNIAFSKYFVQPGLCDHFLYSFKNQPEKYLDPEVRKNTSAFSAFSNPAEVAAGVEKLGRDIASGEIRSVMKRYENTLGDYLFFVADKK